MDLINKGTQQGTTRNVTYWPQSTVFFLIPSRVALVTEKKWMF